MIPQPWQTNKRTHSGHCKVPINNCKPPVRQNSYSKPISWKNCQFVFRRREVRMPLFRGMKRWGVILSVVLLSSLLLTACGENSPNVLDPQGPVANLEAGLFWFVLVVATIVFVAVEGWLIFSIIRYRARPNTPEPRQIHGNNTVELIWTVLPSLFLFAVLAGTIYTLFGLQNIPGNGNLNVTVVGHQWWWEFDYPNKHIVTADTLYIPQGTVINLSEVSNNVIHSFWIPKITGKIDDIPGHINTKIFRADTVGVFRRERTEYCGVQHANMNFSVVVLPSDSFNSWVSSQQVAAQTPTDTLAAQGQKVFTGVGACTGCHGIWGVNLSALD